MRTIGLMLVLALLFAFTPAIGDSSDVSSLGDDELLAMFDAAKDEIEKRGLPKSGELPKGEYYIGQDIAEGSYVFSGMLEDTRVYYYIVPADAYEKYLELSEELNLDLLGIKWVDNAEHNSKEDLKNGMILLVESEGLKLTSVVNTLAP